MANKKFWLGILAVALVFGMTVVGCDDGSTDNDGGSGANGVNTTYTVSYDVGAGSGSAPASQNVISGTTIYLPGQGNMTAPSGSNFTGWRTGGQNYSVGSSYTVNGNTMFIAQWEGSSQPNPNPGPSVPGTPSNVTAARNPAGSTTIRISWTSVSGATSYNIYYSTTGSGSGILDGTSTTTSYDSTNNSTDTTWYFRVSAVNSVGEGSPSSWVSVGSSAGAVPGSSSSNAITISGSISGSFPAGLDAVWYKFTKTGTGIFDASDRYYSSTYTADIVVDVYSASLNLMSGPIYYGGSFSRNGNWENIDVGGSNSSRYYLYATNWSGTYYVKVKPYNNNNANKGTFALFAP